MMTAQLSGCSLTFQHSMITSTDLIDLMILGRPVPVFSDGVISGQAVLQGNLIHVTGNDRCILGRKCVRGLLDGRVLSIRVQPMPEGVAL
jgi:hypothetical protein